MKLVNAEIKTAEELAQRILNKEILFTENGLEIQFNDGFIDESPLHASFYQLFDDGVLVAIDQYQSLVPQTIQRLAEWHEQTDSLVPCFVWDDSEIKNDVKRIRMVIPCKKYHLSGAHYFETYDRNQWHNATPLTEADLFKAE